MGTLGGDGDTRTPPADAVMPSYPITPLVLKSHLVKLLHLILELIYFTTNALKSTESSTSRLKHRAIKFEADSGEQNYRSRVNVCCALEYICKYSLF